MKNTAPGPSVARKTEVDWGSLAEPPVEEWKPTTPEERAAEQQRKWQAKLEQELAEETFHDTVDAMVIHFENDPEGLRRCLGPASTTSIQRSSNSTDRAPLVPLGRQSLLDSVPCAELVHSEQ